MICRVQTGVVVTMPGLSPGSGTHSTPAPPLGHGRQLPAVTPASRGLVATLGVYPSPNLHRLEPPVSGQILVVLLDICLIQSLILPPNG